MTDRELAIRGLHGHRLCLCRNGSCITDDGRGISALMRLLSEGTDLRGYTAADPIVGKAAALLYVKAEIAGLHAGTLSRGAQVILEQYGIPYSFDLLTDRIINREGTDICPMERTVLEIDEPEAAFSALQKRLKELQKGRNTHEHSN